MNFFEAAAWGAFAGVLFVAGVDALMRLGDLLDDTWVMRAMDRVSYSRPMRPVMWVVDLICYRWRPRLGGRRR